MMQPTLLDIGTRRFRLRRINKRNLVIERQTEPKRLWIIQSYHSTARSLAIALVNLVGSGHCPDPKGRIAGECEKLRLAIQDGIDRLAEQLAGLDDA